MPDDDRTKEQDPGRRVGRPSTLSEQRILNAAAGIAFEELSFGRIAEDLGVSPQALYKYYSNIGELRSSLAASVVREVEFLDDQPLGDFEAYVVRFLLDYRDWLVENSLAPDLFAIEYGAARFEQGASPEPLFVRLEDFLSTADREGVPLAAAMKVWLVITDWMAVSRSVLLPEHFLREFHEALESDLGVLEADRFPQVGRYLAESGDEALSGREVYEFSVRALVRGLLIQTGLREP